MDTDVYIHVSKKETNKICSCKLVTKEGRMVALSANEIHAPLPTFTTVSNAELFTF